MGRHEGQPLTGRRCHPHRDLVGAGEGAAQDVRSQRVRHEAVVDDEDVVRPATAEAGPPVTHCGTHRRAEPVCREHRTERHGDVVDPAEAAERVGHHRSLEAPLGVGAACWRSQPPQPASTNRHGGTARSTDGTSTSTTRRVWRALRSTISARAAFTRPGASGTNTTTPSEERARPSPPATMADTSSSTTSPTTEAVVASPSGRSALGGGARERASGGA
ncbi:MAG: hypothetical protein R2690_08380 [Acidimicrobiales bacterium]